MAFMKRIKKIAVAIALVFLFPSWALALPQEKGEEKNAPVQGTKQVILLVVDGLQADSVNASIAPNINGLGMAGVMAERVSVMPPDKPDIRFYSLLSGIDLATGGMAGEDVLLGGTILSLMEKRGIKTAFADGTGQFGQASEGISFNIPGPFKDDGAVVDRAIEILKNKKPFFTVIALSGPGKAKSATGTESKDYVNSVSAADNEVGRLLKQLHIDGTYEGTILVVAGTTGKPPLIIKGKEFLTGTRLPPVCLKDLAPTLGYLLGINLTEASGLVIWNSFQPGPDRTESFMHLKRISDLSNAYAGNIEEGARLENEKVIVQEEKARLAREKQTVEDEMAQRDRKIEELSLVITVMKAIVLLGIVLFLVTLVVEYRILKKRYLFFT